MRNVTRWLKQHLRVEVNVTKSKVSRPNDIKYLGFGFYCKDGKWRPKPHIKSVNKLKFKLKPLFKRNWGVSLAFRIEKINEVTRGWINYFRIADMKKLMEELDQKIRLHLRIIIWKQWKKVKRRFKALMALGMKRKMAWAYANTRKGPYVTGIWLGRWIKNVYLKRKGLLTMADHYNVKHHTIQLQFVGL